MPQVSTPQRSSPLIIFAHLPKTAGITVEAVLRSQYGTDKIFLLTRQRNKRIREYAKLPAHQKAKFQLIRGHIGYGIHQTLGEPNCVYFTILRHPIDRIISHYYFHKNRSDNPLSEQILAENIDLKSYVTDIKLKDLDNHQTRLIVGEDEGMEPEFGQCPSEFLDIAKTHLQNNFAAVGTTERLDETLLVMQKIFGWSTPFYLRKNVTQNRPSVRDISPEVVAAIAHNNQLDAALHAHANEWLDQQIATQFRFFKLRLWRFRILNRLYSILYNYRQFLPKPVQDKLAQMFL